jgi:hypothetical protein
MCAGAAPRHFMGCYYAWHILSLPLIIFALTEQKVKMSTISTITSSYYFSSSCSGMEYCTLQLLPLAAQLLNKRTLFCFIATRMVPTGTTIQAGPVHQMKVHLQPQSSPVTVTGTSLLTSLNWHC